MADIGPVQGWNNPTITTGTEANWTTPDNVFLSDDSDAVFSGSAQEQLHVEAFNFDLPPDVIVRGIEVSVEAQSTGTRTLKVQLTKNGTAVTGTAKTQVLTASDVIYRLGGATDLWSATDGLSVAEINAATFGVFITDNVASASDITVDHVMIRVYIDGGIRARWDVDFVEKQITHIDVIVDYDGGASGTAPADGEVLFNSTPVVGGVGRIIRDTPASVLVAGSLQLGETHDGSGELSPTWDDADALEVCSFVDFNTEVAGGIDETDIGSSFAASGGTGTRTGVIRHVESDGTAGRLWWDVTGETGTALTGDEDIQIAAVTVASASAAETSNAWTGVINTAGVVPSQGYVDYDTETIKMEAISGLERIRDSQFQHNLCVYGTTSGTHAMVVHDFEDPNDAAVGRLYLADLDGAGMQNSETIIALLEQDYDVETADWNVGDVVGDSGTPTDSFTIRRLIDNGDLTGTMYMQRLAGSGFFTDGQALFLSGGSQQADADGITRQRVGSVSAGAAQVDTDVQWRMNHLYTDIQRQMAASDGLQMDDTIPQTSQVQDAQYTSVNLWEMRTFSTRRARGGAINQHDIAGGADNDDVFTNDAHLGSLNITNGVQAIYVAQDIKGTGEEVLETFWDAGPHDILIRNRIKNAKIDGGTRRHLIRNWGDFYDWFKLSKIGGANAIPLNSADDGNNATTYAVVRDDASKLYHRIILAWASHTIDFNTGSGTAPVPGDVIMNTTDGEAVIVVRGPDSNVSGTDLHIGAHGQDISGWGDGSTLDLCNYIDYDGQVAGEAFVIGDAIDDGGSKTGTVRFIQAFGSTRGRIWLSPSSGDWANDDNIEVGATVVAVADGAEVIAGVWTALTNTATPETIDLTALLDTGVGGENSYRCHVVMNSATIAQLYEFLKFVTEERAGDPTIDPGSLLFPDDASKEGRLYIAASSTYPEAQANKVAPFGSKAGTLFQGARGIFISGMDSADVQNFTLLDDVSGIQVPPNTQTITVGNMEAGYNVTVFSRPVLTQSLTYTAGGTDSTITGAGDFLEEGFAPGMTVDILDTTLNDGSDVGRLKTVVAGTLTFEGIVLSTEGAVSSTITGSGVHKREYTGHATNNTSGAGTFEVLATIDADLPSSGFIRLVSTAGSETSSGGFEYRLAYTSFTGAVFTLGGTLPQTFDGTARLYVPYIDVPSTAGATENQGYIHSSGFPVLIVARKVGFDPFTSRADVSASGLAVNIVRAVDPIVE